MRHVQLMLIGGCSQVKVLQQLERNHHRHLDECNTGVLRWSIPSAKNFLGCCLNHSISLSKVNEEHLWPVLCAM
jgi:hypothetical protein